MPSSRGSSRLSDQTCFFGTGGRFFTAEPLGKPGLTEEDVEARNQLLPSLSSAHTCLPPGRVLGLQHGAYQFASCLIQFLSTTKTSSLYFLILKDVITS